MHLYTHSRGIHDQTLSFLVFFPKKCGVELAQFRFLHEMKLPTGGGGAKRRSHQTRVADREKKADASIHAFSHTPTKKCLFGLFSSKKCGVARAQFRFLHGMKLATGGGGAKRRSNQTPVATRKASGRDPPIAARYTFRSCLRVKRYNDRTIVNVVSSLAFTIDFFLSGFFLVEASRTALLCDHATKKC